MKNQLLVISTRGKRKSFWARKLYLFKSCRKFVDFFFRLCVHLKVKESKENLFYCALNMRWIFLAMKQKLIQSIMSHFQGHSLTIFLPFFLSVYQPKVLLKLFFVSFFLEESDELFRENSQSDVNAFEWFNLPLNLFNITFPYRLSLAKMTRENHVKLQFVLYK